ncbi:hypothetical protein NECAME_04161 [Necator americanus]|uniref:BAR domain-containing protein n=1 Tax=Necator americanus TaxID=51031 RepID=W2SZI9_NECAM|nr:hypothetical protein NECAME_04161 [Necator americanus]ETN74132.1 hypothetical protein NECAME_04161 [Necator americanus]
MLFCSAAEFEAPRRAVRIICSLLRIIVCYSVTFYAHQSRYLKVIGCLQGKGSDNVDHDEACEFPIHHAKAAERIGIVEETKLEPTFEEGIKKVEAYRLAVDSALDGLEAMMQPNRSVVESGAIMAPAGQNPHELMYAACLKLKQFLDTNGQARLDIVMTTMGKLAEQERFSQTKGRAAVRRIRRFVTVDNQQMKEDMAKMRSGLEIMDVARHEVLKHHVQIVGDWM